MPSASDVRDILPNPTAAASTTTEPKTTAAGEVGTDPSASTDSNSKSNEATASTVDFKLLQPPSGKYATQAQVQAAKILAASGSASPQGLGEDLNQDKMEVDAGNEAQPRTAGQAENENGPASGSGSVNKDTYPQDHPDRRSTAGRPRPAPRPHLFLFQFEPQNETFYPEPSSVVCSTRTSTSPSAGKDGWVDERIVRPDWGQCAVFSPGEGGTCRVRWGWREWVGEEVDGGRWSEGDGEGEGCQEVVRQDSRSQAGTLVVCFLGPLKHPLFALHIESQSTFHVCNLTSTDARTGVKLPSNLPTARPP
jgi:hypothetical protein